MKLTHTIISAIAATVGVSSAATVSVNFSSNGNSGGDHAVGTSTTAGVEAVQNWNDVTGGTGSASNVNDSTGAATTVDVDWATGTWGGTAATGTVTGNDALMGAWLDDGSMLVTISEIPYAQYDVIVYGTSDAGNDGRNLGWMVNGVDSESIGSFGGALTNGTFFDGTFVDGTTPTANPSYLRFNGLTGATLTIADHTTGSATLRSALSGFQIVEAVPEPSSTALLGLGGLALILRRRK